MDSLGVANVEASFNQNHLNLKRPGVMSCNLLPELYLQLEVFHLIAKYKTYHICIGKMALGMAFVGSIHRRELDRISNKKHWL